MSSSQLRNSYWFLESSELGEYLEREYGWPGLKFCGVIRRRRWKGTRVKDQGAWEEQEFLWVAALERFLPAYALIPARYFGHLRPLWAIAEQGYFGCDYLPFVWKHHCIASELNPPGM
jgi:hypothetical protein